MLDPKRLLALEVVVRVGSFTAAAELLHLTQPSVSRQVAALETECGVPLLVRTPTGPTPTPEGEALLRRAVALRTELTAIDATVAAFSSRQAGEVRIGSFPTAAAALVAPALNGLRRRYPRLRTTVREASRHEALTMLRGGELEIAVTFDLLGDEPRDTYGLQRRRLLDEPLLVALPAGHRLAGRATVALPALRREGWIVGTASGSPGPIERACQAAGFAPDVVANADDQPTIQALVAGGVAVTLIPRLGTQGAHPGIVFLPVRPAPVVRRLTALTLDLTPRSPATESVLDALSSAAEAAVGLGASSPGRTERSKQTRETARGA